ncbi:MAG TPA: J domain-containing protein [Trebonia sp.]|nr:J domain-containing protein [Trebonia sp.]
MAAADHGGPRLDLYQLLGVPPDASRDEIAQAWRRRARDEHPDSRPGDADAPGRFRALAEAWQVLGDPARRAAYDRALARERQPAVRVAGPPLRAGPVRVERPRPAPPAASRDEDIGLAVLAELALRFLARDRGQPW